MLVYKNITYTIGSILNFRIRGENITGRLYYDGRHYYVCHNNPTYDGKTSPEKYEYSYSWGFRAEFGSLLDEVEILSKVDSKDDFSIDSSLSEILNSFDSTIVSLISLKNILPTYLKFKTSNKPGLIEMVNDKGSSVEIKLGRFLRSLSNISNSFTFSDKDIETFHNRYLSYQNGDVIKVSFVKGSEILDLYKTDNYLSNNSRLGKSCMNNAFEYLSLYTDNIDVVEAIAIKKYDRIVGRAILWTLSDGRKLLDKTYTCNDWVDDKYDEIVRDNNYLKYHTSEKLKIQLKPGAIDKKVPYLDTFYFYNNESGELFNYQYNSNYKLHRFRNTDGTYA